MGGNHCERGIRRVPINLIPKLIEVLECTEADLPGVTKPARQKRGPLSAWEKRISTIKALPRDKQKEIQSVVDALIAQSR